MDDDYEYTEELAIKRLFECADKLNIDYSEMSDNEKGWLLVRVVYELVERVTKEPK